MAAHVPQLGKPLSVPRWGINHTEQTGIGAQEAPGCSGGQRLELLLAELLGRLGRLASAGKCVYSSYPPIRQPH